MIFPFDSKFITLNNSRLCFRCFTDPSLCHNDYTFSIWLYLRTPKGGNGAGVILNSESQSHQVRTGSVWLSHENNAITVGFRVRTGENSEKEWIACHSAPNQQWFHLAATWKMNGQLRVYKNGQLSSSRCGSDFTPLPSTYNNTMHLGKATNVDWSNTNAAIDELYIWQYEKSAVQIHELALRSKCWQTIKFMTNSKFCTIQFSSHDARSYSNYRWSGWMELAYLLINHKFLQSALE